MVYFSTKFPGDPDQELSIESKNTISERRKFGRIQPQHDTVVFNGDFFGQLVDISPAGLAFAYSKGQNQINDIFFEIDIMCCNKKLHITKILCKSIMDTIYSTSISESIEGARRRSVEFNSLSSGQAEQLKQYLKNIVPHGGSFTGGGIPV